MAGVCGRITGMAWRKGVSGNPKGRPPKERALTAVLQIAAGRSVVVGGRRLTPRREVARLVWQALATGELTFARVEGDVTLRLGPEEWIRLLAWVYEHIDGPAPRAQAEPLEVVTWSVEEWKAEAERRRREAAEVEGMFGGEEGGRREEEVGSRK